MMTRSKLTAGLAAVAPLTLAACADPVADPAPKSGDPSAVSFDTSAKQQHVTSAKVDSIAAEVPAAIRDSGKLVVGSGSAGGGLPPLAFTADDNKTPIGVEIDIAYLVSSVLGLTPEIQTTSWENLFLGLDSGKYQVGISNIGVSELRKEKYDFATYRLGLHAFEAKKGSGLSIKGPADIAGKTIAVGSGTLRPRSTTSPRPTTTSRWSPAGSICISAPTRPRRTTWRPRARPRSSARSRRATRSRGWSE
jgi:polar amino acid transport system substrate-binding protein